MNYDYQHSLCMNVQSFPSICEEHSIICYSAARWPQLSSQVVLIVELNCIIILDMLLITHNCVNQGWLKHFLILFILALISLISFSPSYSYHPLHSGLHTFLHSSFLHSYLCCPLDSGPHIFLIIFLRVLLSLLTSSLWVFSSYLSYHSHHSASSFHGKRAWK